MSEELPPQTGAPGEDETKVIYYFDEEETPYMIKIPVPSSRVTLGDFKKALNNPLPHQIKYFFRSVDEDIGMVKEEITEDGGKLPNCNGRVVSWLVTADGSAHSDGSSGLRRAGAGAKMARGPTGTPIAAGGPGFSAAAAAFDNTGATSDTESTLSGLPNFGAKHGSKLDRRMLQPQFGPRYSSARRGRQTDGDSTITTDSEATRYSDDDRSRVSTSTGITSVSQQFYRQRKRRRRHRAPVSRTSSITSITESSMSLNIIKVTLNMDSVSFLGISIVGQSNQRGDGGIYVANIMKGGAVALDGRIEPGDMILQVNDVSFENMSNDDAVGVLRDAVQKSGRIELVVAKCWDPTPKGYFTIPRQEPVRPIDPGAWVAHTNAFRNAGAVEVNCPTDGGATPTPGGFGRPSSVNTVTSQNSGSLTSSMPESDRKDGFFKGQGSDVQLDVGMEMGTIVWAMARPDSGLDIRDRVWLKIKIPQAFLGSDIIEWLLKHVQGFTEKRDARKYAAQMLKNGFIKHTVNKITFSEQCYYVFGDNICADMGRLTVSGPHSYHQPGPLLLTSKPGDDGSQSDQDTFGPLPPPPAYAGPAPWAGPTTGLHPVGLSPNLGMGHMAPTAPSMASGYASLPGAPFPFASDAGSFPSLSTGSTGLGSTPTVPVGPNSEVQTAVSNESNGSSGSSERNRAKPPAVPPKPPTGSLPCPPPMPMLTSLGAVGAMTALHQQHNSARTVEEVPRDLTSSRQSFRIAMGNPCEFFVDYM